jgi:decaprenylphospho-beta-D-erythro-pentofuranosid-2-ulose 2-reductase
MKVLIVGATSAIAHETAKCFALDGAELFLVGRNPQKLDVVHNDLKVRGAKRVESFVLDLNELTRHQELVNTAISTLGSLDVALLAHGTLSDQDKANADVDFALREFSTNATSYISLMTLLANYFEQQRKGNITVISSVAGERGRGSNYIYGAAKGAVTLFAGGLRNRLSKCGVSVTTIKPGFVDTPMTADKKKNALFADPQAVGQRIYKAIQRGEDIVYVPWFWMLIMGLIRNIPERIFKRLSL